MTLYEMNAATRQLYELLQNEEIDEQTFNDTLESIGVEHKIDSYCEVIRQMQADIEMLDTEIERLEKRKKPLVNSIDRMKKALTDHLFFRGEKKMSTVRFTVRLTSSERVQVVNENIIPKKYWVKQDPKLDKASIRELLKSGQKVKGCELIKNTGVVIK